MPLKEAPWKQIALLAGRGSTNSRVPSLLRRDPGPWLLTPVQWSRTNTLGIALPPVPPSPRSSSSCFVQTCVPCECFSTTGCGQLSRCLHALLCSLTRRISAFRGAGQLPLFAPGPGWLKRRHGTALQMHGAMQPSSVQIYPTSCSI